MHNPASVHETETHKLLWDFDIPTGHPIWARRLDIVTINKKKINCRTLNSAVPAVYRIKLKENEKKDKYLDLSRELRKLWKM